MSDGLRQSAVLLSCLDGATADRVLSAMSRAAAAKLSRLAADLGPVSDGERRRALEAYYGSRTVAPPARGGRLATRLADVPDADSPAADPPAANAIDASVELNAAEQNAAELNAAELNAAELSGVPNLTGSDQDQSLADACCGAPPNLAAAALERERPQVIAAVLSRLAPAAAGEILQQLCEDLQAEVLDRVADLGRIDADVQRRLLRELSASIRHESDRQVRRQAGQSTVQAIIESASPADISGRHESSSDRDGEPRGGHGDRQRGGCRLAFADLQQLDDDSLRRVVRAAPSRMLRVAVLDAEPKLAARITAMLPRRSRPMGPLMLADIERAQQQVAHVAAQLIDEGAIVLAAGSRLAAAA